MERRAASKGACSDHQMTHEDMSYEMNGADLVKGGPCEYSDSLHYKINQNLKNQPQILNRWSRAHTKLADVPFQFGTTKLEEYQQMSTLGKGTYGEVNKCIHTKTNTVVALKTFLFEVSH